MSSVVAAATVLTISSVLQLWTSNVSDPVDATHSPPMYSSRGWSNEIDPSVIALHSA
jgi:hypothetical protein